MTVQQSLITKDAEMCVDIKCHISWRLPPKNMEELEYRTNADRVLAKVAMELQESVGHVILSVLKIKSE